MIGTLWDEGKGDILPQNSQAFLSTAALAETVNFPS